MSITVTITDISAAPGSYIEATLEPEEILRVPWPRDLEDLRSCLRSLMYSLTLGDPVALAATFLYWRLAQYDDLATALANVANSLNQPLSLNWDAPSFSEVLGYAS